MSDDTLKVYVGEVITELAKDEKFIARMHGAMKPDLALRAKQLAAQWMRGVEVKVGRALKANERSAIEDLARTKYIEYVMRFRGDQATAAKALTQQLDAKFLRQMKMR